VADWTFERDTLTAPKGRQRVRVTATLVAVEANLNPRNYEHPLGSYYETFIREGDVRFRRSHWAVPPFEFEVAVTATGTAGYPWAYTDHRTRVWLLWEDSGDGYQAASDDEGFTWGAPAVAIAGGSKPYGAVNVFDGTEVISAFIAASGKIGMKRRQVGELAYGTLFHLKDDAGVDLLFEDDTHAYWWAYEAPNRLVGHFHLDGETDTSTWFSTDSGETWMRAT
jgi:hypothetical protein